MFQLWFYDVSQVEKNVAISILVMFHLVSSILFSDMWDLKHFVFGNETFYLAYETFLLSDETYETFSIETFLY